MSPIDNYVIRLDYESVPSHTISASFEPARTTYDIDMTVETMCQQLRLSCGDVKLGVVVAREMSSVTVCNHRQRMVLTNLDFFVKCRRGLS